ncbi:catalase [Paenibacillus glucanolyticus]|uniref:catalase n=1 Tax=Paenibacillus glucanolyticus TaxID=59843 RepID=UPI00096EAAD8|nr:catalase [Paenibacillus glucanolyticus]OMF76378.1 catalase HPII [Paenibacillus glucanolyticus]
MDNSNSNPNANNQNKTSKDQQLEQFTVDNDGKNLTTNQGLNVSEDEHSLKVGERGPTLMEDFHFREKMTHFDHERIPERIVHARGFGAHGYFQVYESMKDYTKAKFLQDPSVVTPVFVRFSTVAGSRGSADTVRDVRGFATKFYTEEGNYDLVGNNMPVFFIQDAMKFPDFIHAVKPEPHNEIPQAQSAHDTFWDFVVHNTESAHMIMWAMSDRSLPRSFRMMEGFGVHTFRFVNEEGKAHFVKFHWKPVLGTHSLVWDETQKLAGKDPDFNRRDLWDAIESGNYPEYEFGVQMIPEEAEFDFNFDILDPTKVWPEEIIPVKIIGKMTLNRNTDNFFAETEQIAFHPGHVVPGIDFTNDPLLQGRLFSYTDTQLSRLGGPNFHEIPINRSVAPVHNNQRDGMHRMTINKGPVSYHKNGIAGNTPKPVPPEKGGYEHYTEKVEGRKVQARSDSFKDHFSQAAMFWNSMSDVEKMHIVSAFQFELGKVQRKEIRQQVVDLFAHVDSDLATRISEGIGTIPPQTSGSASSESSPALSMMNTVKLPLTRKVAVLAGNGFTDELPFVLSQLQQAGIIAEVVSPKLGTIKGKTSGELEVQHSLLGADSVLFDAVLVAGGALSVSELLTEPKTLDFIKEAYQHFKPIGAIAEGANLLPSANGEGIVIVQENGELKPFGQAFMEAIAAHRHWTRAI